MESKIFELPELTRKEFKTHLDLGHFESVIIPTGSIEQHLDHLSMNLDIQMSRYVATQAATKLYPKTLVVSPISFGIAEHHMYFPGTLSAKPGSWLSILFDLIESILRHGIKKILILNGHGGNITPVNGIIEQWQLNLYATQNTTIQSQISDSLENHYEYLDAILKNKKNDIDIKFLSYWDLIPENLINSILETKEYPGHATEFETSLAMYAIPESVRFEKLKSSKEIGVNKASASKGEKLAKEAITQTIQTINNMTQ